MSAVAVEDLYEPAISVPLDEAGCREVRICRVWIDGVEYHAIQSYEPIHEGRSMPDWRWHISVSGLVDVPKWSVLVEIVHRMRPGVVFVVGIPPRSWWINVHPHVLHAYEVKDANLEAQWRAEGQGHEPS